MSATSALTTLADKDARFADRLLLDGECLRWCGALTEKGYGRLRRLGRQYRAHRWAYELVCGEIPTGLQIDHLCRVRNCVNPEHLEPVTSRENTMRGQNHVAQQAARQACIWGHRFDELNTYHYRGKRYCRACKARRGAPAPTSLPCPTTVERGRGS